MRTDFLHRLSRLVGKRKWEKIDLKDEIMGLPTQSFMASFTVCAEGHAINMRRIDAGRMAGRKPLEHKTAIHTCILRRHSVWNKKWVPR